MFEFLREWMKSTAVKRQETLNAYLDGELLPQDRVAFERLLADDAALQQELADRQLIKSQLRQLPRVAVPRNFILDVNAYRKPVKRPLITYYPVLRGATALTAVIFIFTLGWSMIGNGASYNDAAPAQESAMAPMAEVVMDEVVEEELAVEEITAEMEAPAAYEMTDMARTPADGVVSAEEAVAGASAENDADASMMLETAVFTPTITAVPTAVPTATPTPTQPEPPPSPTLTNSQLTQMGLLTLFIILLSLTLYTKRQR